MERLESQAVFLTSQQFETTYLEVKSEVGALEVDNKILHFSGAVSRNGASVIGSKLNKKSDGLTRSSQTYDRFSTDLQLS